MFVMPKVSVIIPVYNVEDYILPCLASVCEQDFCDLELIIVDDCGTDLSMKRAESFLNGQKVKTTFVRHAENKGLSAARNSGLKVAKGEYVLFLDSDDLIPKSAIQTLVSGIESVDCDYVFGSYLSFPSNRENNEIQNSGCTLLVGEQIVRSYLDTRQYTMAWNKLLKRHFLLDNDIWFDEGLIHEDVAWTFKVVATAASALMIPSVTYHYRVRESSIMTSLAIEDDAECYMLVFDVISSFIKERHLQNSALLYEAFEGKRCGILYSLLERKSFPCYSKVYESFSKSCYVCPVSSFMRGIIPAKSFLRDVHYFFPSCVGAVYKYIFYLVCYKLFNRQIRGRVWA